MYIYNIYIYKHIYIYIYIYIYIWSKINAGCSSPLPNGVNRNTIFLLKITMED